MGLEGEGEEEDALERRGFRDRLDLHLGAIEQTKERKRKREKEGDNQKSSNKTDISKYKELKVRMHENA